MNVFEGRACDQETEVFARRAMEKVTTCFNVLLVCVAIPKHDTLVKRVRFSVSIDNCVREICPLEQG